MKFMSTGYYTSGVSNPKYHTGDLSIQHHQRKKRRNVQKRVEEVLARVPEGFTVLVLDESIFVHDVLVRRKIWAPKEIHPVVTITGSHQKTNVFGTLTIDCKQFSRQYHAFNENVFLDYLKKLQEKIGKIIILLMDREQHNIIVQERLEHI
jgi:DDE superfamily endonuclease